LSLSWPPLNLLAGTLRLRASLRVLPVGTLVTLDILESSLLAPNSVKLLAAGTPMGRSFSRHNTCPSNTCKDNLCRILGVPSRDDGSHRAIGGG
jgi:hypothetical protein